MGVGLVFWYLGLLMVFVLIWAVGGLGFWGFWVGFVVIIDCWVGFCSEKTLAPYISRKSCCLGATLRFKFVF